MEEEINNNTLDGLPNMDLFENDSNEEARESLMDMNLDF